jgi:hypothetical protein
MVEMRRCPYSIWPRSVSSMSSLEILDNVSRSNSRPPLADRMRPSPATISQPKRTQPSLVGAIKVPRQSGARERQKAAMKKKPYTPFISSLAACCGVRKNAAHRCRAFSSIGAPTPALQARLRP